MNRPMYKFPRLGIPALLAFVLAGCGGDDVAGPEPDLITGFWNATSAEYVSSPPGSTEDLVAIGGTVTLMLAEDGAFLFAATPPGEAAQATEGIWVLDGGVLTMTPQGMQFSWQFDATLAGDDLQLAGASVEYDFDGDGTPEQATLDLQLVRAADPGS